MTDPTITIELTIPTAVAHKLSESFEGTLADAALTALKLYHGLGAPARATLQTLSEQHNTTPAKALRTAIEHFHKDSARLRLGSAPAGRPVVNQDRDAEIYARIKLGSTHATIAAQFNISLVRVGQIVARQRAMRNEPARPKKGLPPNPNTTTTTTPQPEQPVQPEPEVLTLKEPEPTSEPTQPRKLAVIPPSMKNPELFRKPEDRPQPVPVDKLDTAMFEDEYPLDEVFDLRGLTKHGE